MRDAARVDGRRVSRGVREACGRVGASTVTPIDSHVPRTLHGDRDRHEACQRAGDCRVLRDGRASRAVLRRVIPLPYTGHSGVSGSGITRVRGALLSSLHTGHTLSSLITGRRRVPQSPTRRAIPSPRFLVIASRMQRSGALRQLRLHVVDVIAEMPANATISCYEVTR